MADSTDPFSSSVIPFQLPEQVRAFAEKGVSQARENYTKLKDAAESHNGAIEAMFASATKGTTDYSAKMLDIVKANTTATFDLMQGLTGAKTLPEAFEMLTAHTKHQVEAITAQTKELAEFGQKVAAQTMEPIKASAEKIFKPAA